MYGTDIATSPLGYFSFKHIVTKTCALRKKARQARSGHRGHVLGATHSLEAGGMCWGRHILSKPGAVSRCVKK
ncbi:MAG: hypothetical protein FWF77_00535 [Defluviitaleaceae bacterium]|nr:hypothetical protein [Defluviitaleaceae bacterium]